MNGIGGNTVGIIQIRDSVTNNAIGEAVESWAEVQRLVGWLDLSSGTSRYDNYNRKIQESSHIFIADYVELDSRITAENARMIVGRGLYDITLIDNPMGLGHGSQLEIYLKYTGGQ